MYNIGNRHRPSPLFFYVFGPAIAMNSQTGLQMYEIRPKFGQDTPFLFHFTPYFFILRYSVASLTCSSAAA